MSAPNLPDGLDHVLNRLAKWRGFFTSWQVGTRPVNDGESRAIKHHRELTIIMRAEISALQNLLISKGLIKHADLVKQLQIDARALDAAYQAAYPGFRAEDSGMVMTLPAATDTMRVLNFPP